MAITQTLATTTLGEMTHAFEATQSVAVTSIHLCNVTEADSTVNIYILPEDGSTTTPTENNKIYNKLTVQRTDTYIIDTEKMILGTGDKIYIETPDSSGQIVCTISTIGL